MRTTQSKIDLVLKFLAFLSIGSFVFMVYVASAADIAEMTLPKNTSVITVVSGEQYAICDTCPSLSQLNEIMVEEKRPAPLAIRFSDAPAIIPTAQPVVVPKKDLTESVDRTLLTVNFSLNSARVEGGEREKLRGAIPSLRKEAPISLSGYTCDLGSQEQNDKLAIRRAEAVRSELFRSGFPGGDIAATTGKGRCCYADADPARRSLNRRVEVKSYKKTSKEE